MDNQMQESKATHTCDVELISLTDLKEKFDAQAEYCSMLEDSKKQLELRNKMLETSLSEQLEKYKALETDNTFLRGNIRKASANWFEKKARLSESENAEGDQIDPSNSPDSDSKDVKDPCLLNKEEAIELFADFKFKSEQLGLSEKRCSELSKRLKDFEQVINDQEFIIHGMREQLDTYFDDNQKMSRQLKEINRLFQDIENINEKEVNPPTAEDPKVPTNEDLPSKEDLKGMSGSVSKTYLKLKELIYEKKSLVTEIERLRTLNIELQLRVSQQESRLTNVSDALQTTWLMVSNLKDEHEKIHTNESILRYQLRDKREILRKLREELEWSREQWHSIRQKNNETEQEWTTLRRELNERRRSETKRNTQPKDECNEATGGSELCESEFEPPVDLLLDMGIEFGVVDPDDEEPVTCVALMEGQDVHAERLQNLEDQCCQLYQKLMSSSSRALTLASHLTTLHEQYAMSDDDDEDDDDDDDDEDFLEDEDELDDENMLVFESIVSPDSDGYDTAYVSEPDVHEPNPEVDQPTLLSSDEAGETSYPDTGIEEESSPYDSSPEYSEEACDILSKRLINFLPKKIELLRADNKKLEEKLQMIQEEKIKTEALLTSTIEFERRQRKQLEEQLSHLGKYVDELQLERNGKIAKIEEELQKKMEDVQQQEAKFLRTEDELESLKEEHSQRGELLQLTALQLQQSENRAQTAEEALNKFKHELDILHQEIGKFRLKDREAKEKCVADNSKSSQTEHSKGLFLSKIQVSSPATYKTEMVNSSQERSNETLSNLNNTNASLTPVYFPSSLILSKSTEFRLPFQLKVGTVLNWEFRVLPQGVRFHISYDQWPNHQHNESPSQEDENTTQVADLRLINPVYVCSSETKTKGRIIPRMSGQFCLVFFNPIARTQELQLKAWISSCDKDNK